MSYSPIATISITLSVRKIDSMFCRAPEFKNRQYDSSSSSSSDSKPRWEYRVFLSFRGEDTRRGFTDHLYASLQRRGITTFRDDTELARGELISSKLIKAIEGSMFAIVVLSPNYASSTWCLEELRTIVECRRNLGQSVIPIFYGVDPSDVRHQRGLFAEAFGKHEERFQGDKEKLKRWRDALNEVADISGWDSKNWHEAKLIESIVEDIQRKSQPKLPSHIEKLVGIDSKVKAVKSLLGMGSKDVRFIGIWGMGGIGKTTIARVVFERIQCEFEVTCFLGSIREESDRNGLLNVQRQLLSHLRSINIYDLYEGRKALRNLLCKKKVLLVLDDVSELSQMENLAGEQDWFGPGSRVVVTTRDKHLLIAHGVHNDFEVGELNHNDALQLFIRKAFKKDQLEEGYMDLSYEVVQYARGLPLALEVLGSFLCGRTMNAWHSALTQIKKVPHQKILDTLKISYDSLHPLEKNMFLDIACFFNGMDKNQAIEIWENCGLCPEIGIEILIERSLVKLLDNDLWMHDLLQEMGRNIVFEESPNNPGKRSRLWSQEDIDRVLMQNKGTEAIQGIVLDLPQQHEAHWNPEAFSKTCELKLLKLHNIQLPLGLKCLPSSLKVLEWRECPLKALPLNIHLDEIVDLKMLHSGIEHFWIGAKVLEYLKFIDLSFSKNLMRFPDISRVPNLQRLVLEGCTGLLEVHASLGLHKKLVVANFENCENLKTLPNKMDMCSLEDLILSGCSKLKKLPEFGESMKRLSTLYADETSITRLPVSLGCLVGLSDFSLKDCKNLVCLPNTIHNLKSLEILDVSGYSNLSRLPEGLKEVKCLEILDASGTAMEELPSFVFHLENLKELSYGRCKGPGSKSGNLFLPFQWLFGSRPVSMGFKMPPISGLQSLQHLDLSHCNLFEGSLPNEIGCLLSLYSLKLSGNNFINLPSTISKLPKLRLLTVDSCRRLQALPELPSALELLHASNCTALETSRFDPSSPRNRLAATQQVCLTRNGYDSLDQFITFLYQKMPVPRYEMLIPGSEIPSWFDHQNSNFFGTLQLHPHRRSIELAGFALCFVLVNYERSEVCKRESFQCEFEGWRPLNGPFVLPLGTPYLEPFKPHLYMLYLSTEKEPKIVWSEIGFSLKPRCRDDGRCGLEVIKCGYRLVYEEDVEDLKRSGSHQWRIWAANDMCNELDHKDATQVDI